jgi:hypothetical protein
LVNTKVRTEKTFRTLARLLLKHEVPKTGLDPEPTGRHGLLRCGVLSLARVGDGDGVDFAIVWNDPELRGGYCLVPLLRRCCMCGAHPMVVYVVVRYVVAITGQSYRALQELDGPTQRCSKKNVSMQRD